jgi:hypothetical protein
MTPLKALLVIAGVIAVVALAATTVMHVDRCGLHFGFPASQFEEFPPDYEHNPFAAGAEAATLAEAQNHIGFSPALPTSTGQPERIFFMPSNGSPTHSALAVVYRLTSGVQLRLIENTSLFTQSSLERLACWQPGQTGEWSLQDIPGGPRAVLIKGRTSETLMWLDHGLTFQATTDPNVEKTQLTKLVSEIHRVITARG